MGGNLSMGQRAVRDPIENHDDRLGQAAMGHGFTRVSFARTISLCFASWELKSSKNRSKVLRQPASGNRIIPRKKTLPDAARGCHKADQ
jgi:hypothetical protein